MAIDNPNYYQEEQIDDRGIIPTRRWATEGVSPSVGLHIDTYDNLCFNELQIQKERFSLQYNPESLYRSGLLCISNGFHHFLISGSD